MNLAIGKGGEKGCSEKVKRKYLKLRKVREARRILGKRKTKMFSMCPSTYHSMRKAT